MKGHHGEIQLIIGPMFSGKTTELIRRCKRYQIANYKCLVIKYANDTRYATEAAVATHDSQSLEAVPAVDLFSIDYDDYDVIGIDEGQFFESLINYAEQLANSGKTVIVAALDGTYQRKGFVNVLNLIPLCESVLKLHAVCMMCYGNASYTRRKSADTRLEVIGGADKYMAVCRQCYHAATPGKTAAENVHQNGGLPEDVETGDKENGLVALAKRNLDFSEKATTQRTVKASPLKGLLQQTI